MHCICIYLTQHWAISNNKGAPTMSSKFLILPMIVIKLPSRQQIELSHIGTLIDYIGVSISEFLIIFEIWARLA